MWGKDGTRPKSAAELVNKGNGLACEILALGTLCMCKKTWTQSAAQQGVL